jgi:hypothetical protein
MTYCCEVWGNTYPTNIRKIIIAQKRALRIIHRLNFNDHSDHFFTGDRIMKFDLLVKFKTAVLMFKAKIKALPSNILKLFNAIQNPTQTRQRNQFQLKSVRTNKQYFCVSYIGVRIWNAIPFTIRASNSLNIFK